MKKLTYNEQIKLLNEAKAKSVPFDEILISHGYSYNSLVYSDERDFKDYKFPNFTPIDERMPVAHDIPCVSFFSGAGGLDLGFKYAGFNNVLDIEINEMFCDTLKKNGAPKVLNEDIHNVDKVISELEYNGIAKNFNGVFHGGPPCQSFSIAANQRFSKEGSNFKRTGFQHKEYGNLLFCYAKLISYFKPEVFLIENVEGLLSIDGGAQVNKLCQTLSGEGYKIPVPRVIDASDYGVPQKRLRTIIVGSRKKTFKYPEIRYKKIPAGSVLAKPVLDPDSNIPRQHKEGSVRRYMVLGFGDRDKLGRVDRIDPTLPSKTIIAGGTNGGGRSHLHPFIPRTMTVRECARLQTFPDDYVFTGSMARQFTQVGNAVPPILAYEIASALYQSVYC